MECVEQGRRSEIPFKSVPSCKSWVRHDLRLSPSRSFVNFEAAMLDKVLIGTWDETMPPTYLRAESTSPRFRPKKDNVNCTSFRDFSMRKARGETSSESVARKLHQARLQSQHILTAHRG